MSYCLSFTGRSSILEATYHPPIDIEDSEFEVGLVLLETYNSVPNVYEKNNKFYYDDKVIEIPKGSYELHDIAEYIEKTLQERELHKEKSVEVERNKREILFTKKKILQLTANRNTLSIELKCNKYNINFDKSNNIGQLLGFTGIKEAKKLHLSTELVSIFETNTIEVLCNISGGSWNNGKKSHSIFEFGLNVDPGYKISIAPSTIIYLPVLARNINNVTLKLVDQEGNLADFRGELITIRLHLRKCR